MDPIEFPAGDVDGRRRARRSNAPDRLAARARRVCIPLTRGRYEMRRTLALATLVVLMASSLTVVVRASGAAAVASSAPTYLGGIDRASFAASETTITATNASTLTERWAAPGAGSYVATQPVVTGGVAYWGDMNGFEHATDATTGNAIWSTYVGSFTPDPSFGCTPNQMGVEGTATVGQAGGRTLVFVPGGGTANGPSGAGLYFFALDPASGAVVWQTRLGTPPSGTNTPSDVGV